jgi:hypothetical protein
MALSNVLERLGRVIFESPFGANRISKDAPELAEIRLAVLDAVKAKSHRVAGRLVFPFNEVRVHLRGVPEEQAPVFESGFLADYLSEEIAGGLARSGFRFPMDLKVGIETTANLPEPGEEWLTIRTSLSQHESEFKEAAASCGLGRLIVLKGVANHSEFELRRPRTNIGRTHEVYRAAGPSRKNDLVFTEDNEVNRTVSREHAHILRSAKSGEYRLINDRAYKGAENCGIWIVRDGLSQPVHRSARGTLLLAGDEIHLGTAILMFQCD